MGPPGVVGPRCRHRPGLVLSLGCLDRGDGLLPRRIGGQVRRRAEYDVDRLELPDDTDKPSPHFVIGDLEAEAAKGVVEDGEQARSVMSA